MSNYSSYWWPDKRQKRWGERFIYPFIVFTQYLTSWYIVLVWSFLLSLSTDQGIFKSLVISVCSSILAYALFNDHPKLEPVAEIVDSTDLIE